jgi:Protein of unknown function (DUF4238)
MSTPKRHHYQSQMILRRFTGDNGLLRVFDKRRSKQGIYSVTPANAFVESHLNSVLMKDGQRHAGLEIWYSTLEGQVAPIIQKIIDAAERGSRPGLTGDERNVWDNFIYHQQKRAPDAFERLGLVDEFRQNLDEHIAEYERDHRPLTEAERDELKSPKAMARMIQNATIQARGAGGEEVIDALAGRGIGIGYIKEASKSFIVGDHPQARMGPLSYLEHYRTELWMPIAPRVAVSPWGDAGTETIFQLNTGQVRKINEVIFSGSNLVASRSGLLLKSLIGRNRR